MKLLPTSALITCVSATLLAFPLMAQQDFSKVEIKTTEVAPNLYMLNEAKRS